MFSPVAFRVHPGVHERRGRGEIPIGPDEVLAERPAVAGTRVAGGEDPPVERAAFGVSWSKYPRAIMSSVCVARRGVERGVLGEGAEPVPGTDLVVQAVQRLGDQREVAGIRDQRVFGQTAGVGGPWPTLSAALRFFLAL